MKYIATVKVYLDGLAGINLEVKEDKLRAQQESFAVLVEHILTLLGRVSSFEPDKFEISAARISLDKEDG